MLVNTENVKLLFEDISSNNNIFINSGTYKANSSDYAQGSYLPNNDWRFLTLAERDNIIGKTSVDIPYDRKIQVINIPYRLLNLFNKIPLSENFSFEEYSKDNYLFVQKVNSEINHFLSRISLNKPKKNLGIFVWPGNQNTTSYVTASNKRKYIGLHLDNSLGVVIDDFYRPNRISFNLGKSPRYFMYLDKHIKDIHEQAKNKCINIKDYRGYEEYFLKNYPQYPVIKVEIRPGQAYIAPTDHILHEGSSLNSNDLDITLVVLGYFDFFKLL